MNTKQTEIKKKEKKSSLTRINEDIFIYIKQGVYVKLKKVFTFDNVTCIGHLDIWFKNAPFYILFDKSMLYHLTIKGYNKCLFIPNMFKQGFDKNGKMYLRCVINNIDCKLEYIPVFNFNQAKELVLHKKKGKVIYAGFSSDINGKIRYIGEAFEIIKTGKEGA